MPQFLTAGSIHPALIFWNVFFPVDPAQRNNHTFGMMVRKPSIPSLIYLLWLFIAWLTNGIFAQGWWILLRKNRNPLIERAPTETSGLSGDSELRKVVGSRRHCPMSMLTDMLIGLQGGSRITNFTSTRDFGVLIRPHGSERRTVRHFFPESCDRLP